MTALVSAVTITILLVYNAFLKDKINKKLCMPLPIELLITVVGTTLFQITNIAEDYNMIQVRGPSLTIYHYIVSLRRRRRSKRRAMLLTGCALRCRWARSNPGCRAYRCRR
jgi:hypothetical protein